MERLKRLAGNDIELGMKIPTIESRASNIPMDKGNYVCCHNGSTDKDLHRICSSQYGHLGSAIGYILTRDVSLSCVHSSRTRRVRTLKVSMTVIL